LLSDQYVTQNVLNTPRSASNCQCTQQINKTTDDTITLIHKLLNNNGIKRSRSITSVQ